MQYFYTTLPLAGLNDLSHSKLISIYYSPLLPSKTVRLDNTETRWRSDIPELTE